MKAIILAAGRGRRMARMTEELPKCLVPLHGRPLIEWQLMALRKAGISEIGIVGGYRIETLRRYDLTMFENSRWSVTNMVSSLMMASPWLSQEPCLVCYSDIVYQQTAIEALCRSSDSISITSNNNWRKLWEARFQDPLSDAESFQKDNSGFLISIGKKSQSLEDIEGQYMGLLKFDPQGWKSVVQCFESLKPADQDRLDMTSLLQKLLERNAPVRVLPVESQWFEVDTESDLNLFDHYPNSNWLLDL